MEIPQKTNNSLGNPHFEETNLDGTLEATLKRVLCIRKVDTIYSTFVKKLALWVKPIA